MAMRQARPRRCGGGPGGTGEGGRRAGRFPQRCRSSSGLGFQVRMFIDDLDVNRNKSHVCKTDTFPVYGAEGKTRQVLNNLSRLDDGLRK